MSAALSLYSLLSCLATRVKNALYDRGWVKPRRAPLPVISVGNITPGGTGKTPLAIEILERLLEDGFRPALVTRGYRGLWEKRGGVLSDGKRFFGGWREAGDEPFMVARRVPRAGVLVGRHRYCSCLKARDLGFDAVVLDDGFQHRKLHRDLDIVLYDPGQKTALRESVSALKRAHLVLLPEDSVAEGRGQAWFKFPASGVVSYKVVPRMFLPVWGREGSDEKSLGPESLRGAKILAFCGIASPERFFRTLQGLGLILLEKIAFPDHYAYPGGALGRIHARGLRLQAQAVLTTEKDAVKLSGQAAPPAGLPLYALRIGLSVENRLQEAVASTLRQMRRGEP